MGENAGIEELVGVFEAFVSEPEDVEAGLVAVAFFAACFYAFFALSLPAGLEDFCSFTCSL